MGRGRLAQTDANVLILELKICQTVLIDQIGKFTYLVHIERGIADILFPAAFSFCNGFIRFLSLRRSRNFTHRALTPSGSSLSPPARADYQPIRSQPSRHYLPNAVRV